MRKDEGQLSIDIIELAKYPVDFTKYGGRKRQRASMRALKN